MDGSSIRDDESPKEATGWAGTKASRRIETSRDYRLTGCIFLNGLGRRKNAIRSRHDSMTQFLCGPLDSAGLAVLGTTFAVSLTYGYRASAQTDESNALRAGRTPGAR